MKVIHNKAREESEKKAVKDNIIASESSDHPLSYEQLLDKLSQIGTVSGREQAVIENLRKKGFN